MSSQLVWLITGTSTGLGRDLTLAALARGDKVVATARARSLTKLDDLKTQGAATLELDVTAPIEELHEVAKRVVAIYGRVDVVVNNAGYMVTGALEENTPEESFAQFNTNVFGPLNVARAFLPYMRPRKTGTVVWFGSIGGWIPLPNGGLYGATKAVNRSLAQTLNAEISPFGLRSICIEPGYFRTAFLQGGNRGPSVSRIEEYKPITGAMDDMWVAVNGKQPGDPKKLVQVMLDLIRGEGVAKEREVPTIVQLGRDCVTAVKTEVEGMLKDMEAWEGVYTSTDIVE
ncbi:hypothetical protein OF83DRAFT_366130 [Amylostereum chailletii]|nr:hypothetical protein OF83DRAFT_366130 [Amylostereum chailletii]